MPTLTDLLSRELLAARRAGDKAVAGTLRSTLSALANAEAVAVADPGVGSSEHVAGLGTGATEVERRAVTDAEQVALVHAEIAELREAAATYAAGHPDRAAAAESGIAVLERVLAEAR